MAILQQAYFRYRKDLKLGKYAARGMKAGDLWHGHSRRGSGGGQLFGQSMTATAQPVCFFRSISITSGVMESENATWSVINSYHTNPAAPVMWATGQGPKKSRVCGSWKTARPPSWKGGRPSKERGVKRRKGSHLLLFAAESFFFPL